MFFFRILKDDFQEWKSVLSVDQIEIVTQPQQTKGKLIQQELFDGDAQATFEPLWLSIGLCFITK